MLVLHAHWQPPQHSSESGGMLFWAEMSEGKSPAWQRGRLAQNPRPKEHPFCAPLQAVQRILAQKGEEQSAVLRLPTSRSGPLPSPELVHHWELDADTPAFLAPWIVKGHGMLPAEALALLVDLPKLDVENAQFVLGADAIFWSRAAALALETLAAQKLVPVLVPADTAGKVFHARWLPILDGPKDGPRLAQLEAAMPPLCRAASVTPELSPRSLLTSFLDTNCDAFARQQGRSSKPRVSRYDSTPVLHWLEALFDEDPTVKASPAQLQALLNSHRLWMRNLYVAGDTAFRITFRLEAPAQQKESDAWQLHYLLQARDDPSLLVSAGDVWKKTGSVLTELGRRIEQPQEKLLAGLGYAARLFPPVAASLKDKRPSQLSLDTQGAYTFLRETAPLLEGAGFGVLVPPWWNKPGARLGVRLKMQKKRQSKDAVAGGKMTLENLVAYQWELSLGETSLSEEEFHSLAALKTPLVQVRGQWVQLDADQIEAAIRFWDKQQFEGEMGLLGAIQFGLGGQDTQSGLPIDVITTDDWLSEWLQKFNQHERLEQLPQPQSLKAQLRPYQLYGYSWLHFFRRWGLGACLADDMGLGKTIQTIALLLKEKENSGLSSADVLPAPSLLICPTSVVTNWEREIQRFAPALRAFVHRGADRLRGEAFIQAARAHDIILTSYPIARLDAETMQGIDWLWVILDEAQNIKNPEAKQTQAIRKFPAEFRLALTGTPVENRLSELWSIMHFLNPDYLGARTKFRKEFSIPIERYDDKEAINRLRQLTSPFILRRVKTDPRVIQDLPEKVETKVYCNLTEEQATLYEAVVQDVMRKIEAQDEEGGGIERRGLVLSMLMQLKQICNHPVQYLHQARKDGDYTQIAERSGKLERLAELLEEIGAEGDRALIFTQFAEMGELLTHYLPQSLGIATQFLHGGTPAKTRDTMVKRFQEHEHAPPIFILSLKAGGTGLNLTRANHVFHFDRWWNPAVEDQATDRAFRIGQKRNVQVHKFVTTGTLEEMIDDMIESKKGLAQAVVGSGEQWLTELSTNELRQLVQLRRE
ncbi:MAG: DEAD/DEAH box helicase [Chloroflexota bacterium]